MDIDKPQVSGPPLMMGAIGMLHIWMRKECDKIFRQIDFPLEMDQITVVLALYYAKRLVQQEISTKLQRDKASVARTVSLLSERKIVTVEQDSTDRRKTRVELTDYGKKLARKADSLIKKFETSLVSKLSEQEASQLYTTIGKLMEPLPA